MNDARWRDIPPPGFPEDYFGRLLRILCKRLSSPYQNDSRPETAEASLLLTNDAEIQRLNAEFRGRDRPTNVLSFPQYEADIPAASGENAAPQVLGDVVLAYETIAREAQQQGKPFTDHAAHLFVHGVLHLLGYDHLNNTDAEIMEALEIAILADYGIMNPYR